MEEKLSNTLIMRVYVPFTMAHLHEIVTFAQSRIMDLHVVSDDYAHIVRIISWIFVSPPPTSETRASRLQLHN